MSGKISTRYFTWTFLREAKKEYRKENPGEHAQFRLKIYTGQRIEFLANRKDSTPKDVAKAAKTLEEVLVLTAKHDDNKLMIEFSAKQKEVVQKGLEMSDKLPLPDERYKFCYKLGETARRSAKSMQDAVLENMTAIGDADASNWAISHAIDYSKSVELLYEVAKNAYLTADPHHGGSDSHVVKMSLVDMSALRLTLNQLPKLAGEKRAEIAEEERVREEDNWIRTGYMLNSVVNRNNTWI